MYRFAVPVVVFRHRRGETRIIYVISATAIDAWNSINRAIERSSSFDIPYLGVFTGIDRIEMGEEEEVENLGRFCSLNFE